jgi:hypothetical protein
VIVTDSRIAKKVWAVFEADWAQAAPVSKLPAKVKEKEKELTPASAAG